VTIAVGDPLPEIELRCLRDGKVEKAGTGELFATGRSVLFAVPGAFTPTCSDRHLPGYLLRVGELRELGVERIACVSVNDAFVMAAWGRERGVDDEILMLADGSGDLATALGLELDARGFGLGMRSRRYAAVIEDGVVTYLGVETEGGVSVSGAEAVLAHLRTALSGPG
jgi:glutaredoxin/glutathione-dependent peroxiredoxin